MNLRGKRVLVTGGAKRIGAAIVRSLAERGCDIVLHYHRSQAEARALARALAKSGVSVELLRADLSRESETLALARKALKKGPIDLLINNASLYDRAPFKRLTLENWDRCLRVNLTSVLLLSQKIGLAMRRRGGRIINIADMAGEQPYRDYLPYCVSKGALLSLTRALAVELAPKVQVNSICPGPVLPSPRQPQRMVERLAKRTPLKKWGGADEVAKAVTFLCQSDFTTGANIVVDGGFQLV